MQHESEAYAPLGNAMPMVTTIPTILPTVTTATAASASTFRLTTTQYADQIQKGYLAFFLRPAEGQGFNYYAAAMNASNGDLSTMTNGFGASPEYLQTYAGYTLPQQVDSLYVNLFGRHAEQAGLDYWSSRLANGTFTINNIAISILLGAQNADAAVVSNRVSVANTFTSHFDSSTKANAYSSTAGITAAKSALASVTDTASTVTAAIASLADTLLTLGAPGASVRPADKSYQTVDGKYITLASGSRMDTLVFSAEGSAGKRDTVTGFDNDKIDLSSFGFSNKAVAQLDYRVAVAASGGVYGMDLNSQLNGKNVLLAYTQDNQTFIYIDVDSNGKLDYTKDTAIEIVGAHLTAADITM